MRRKTIPRFISYPVAGLDDCYDNRLQENTDGCFKWEEARRYTVPFLSLVTPTPPAEAPPDLCAATEEPYCIRKAEMHRAIYSALHYSSGRTPGPTGTAPILRMELEAKNLLHRAAELYMVEMFRRVNGACLHGGVVYFEGLLEGICKRAAADKLTSGWVWMDFDYADAAAQRLVD